MYEKKRGEVAFSLYASGLLGPLDVGGPILLSILIIALFPVLIKTVS